MVFCLLFLLMLIEIFLFEYEVVLVVKGWLGWIVNFYKGLVWMLFNDGFGLILL